jgi:hypothetical protein
MTSPLPDYGINFSNDSSKLKELFVPEHYATHFISQILNDSNYNHQPTSARLWAVKDDDNYHLIEAAADIYGLLDNSYDLSSYNAIIIHTSGWAAPLNEDGSTDTPPSAHEHRRRVTLVSCVNDSAVASALAFSDDSEIVVDNGTATGSLAEALLSFWEKNRI